MKPHAHKDTIPEDMQISAPTLISTNAQDFPDLRSISPAPSLARPRSLSRQRSSPPTGLRKHKNGPYTSSSLARTDSKLGYRPGQYGTVVSITTSDPRSRQRGRVVQSEAGYPTLHNARSSRPGTANYHASGQLKTRWTNPTLADCSANTTKTKVSRWKSLSRFGRKSAAKRNYEIVHQVPIYEKKNNDSELFGRSLTQPVAGPYGVDSTIQEQQQRQEQQIQLQQLHQVQQTPQIQVSDDSASVYGQNPLRMNPQQLERSMSTRLNTERERTSPRPTLPQKAAQSREEKPLLNVAIPKCELERYSVMFGSILQQKDMETLKRISTRTPRASSLLVRRHASLKPLETSHHKAISSRGVATAAAAEKPRTNQEAERGVRSAGPFNPPQILMQQRQQHVEAFSIPKKPHHGTSPSLSLFPAKKSPPTPPLPFRLPSPPPQPPVPPKKPTRLPPTIPPMPNRPAPANIHIPDLRPTTHQSAVKPVNAVAINKTTAPASVAPNTHNIPAPTIIIAPPPESPESMTTLETASSEASYEPSNISITQFPLPAGKSLPPAISTGSTAANSNVSLSDNTNIRSSVEYARPRLIADPAHRDSDTSMEIGIALGDPYLPIHQFSYSSSTVSSIKSGLVGNNNTATTQTYTNGHVYGLSNGGTQFPYPSAPELDLEVDLGQQTKQGKSMGELEKTQQKQLPPVKAVPALVSSRTTADSPAKLTPKVTATKIPKAMAGAGPNTNTIIKPLAIPKAGDNGLGMEMGMGMEQSIQKGLGLGMTMGSGMEKPIKSVVPATGGTGAHARPRVAKEASRAATTKLVNNLNTTTVGNGNLTNVKMNGANKVKSRHAGPGTMTMKQKKPLAPTGMRMMVTASLDA